MRIAVSGTHASGKSTLIEAFLARHPDYAFEPEPYGALQELYGESFAQTPSVEDFERQLEYQLDILHRYRPGDRVIFERCPADFLAYLLAVGDRSDAERWIEPARRGISNLDRIVFLPIDDTAPIDIPDEEDADLRQQVDDHLRRILFDDDLDLLTDVRPIVIEARGSVLERLLRTEPRTGISRISPA